MTENHIAQEKERKIYKKVMSRNYDSIIALRKEKNREKKKIKFHFEAIYCWGIFLQMLLLVRKESREEKREKKNSKCIFDCK